MLVTRRFVLRYTHVIWCVKISVVKRSSVSTWRLHVSWCLDVFCSKTVRGIPMFSKFDSVRNVFVFRGVSTFSVPRCGGIAIFSSTASQRFHVSWCLLHDGFCYMTVGGSSMFSKFDGVRMSSRGVLLPRRSVVSGLRGSWCLNGSVTRRSVVRRSPSSAASRHIHVPLCSTFSRSTFHDVWWFCHLRWCRKRFFHAW